MGNSSSVSPTPTPDTSFEALRGRSKSVQIHPETGLANLQDFVPKTKGKEEYEDFAECYSKIASYSTSCKLAIRDLRTHLDKLQQCEDEANHVTQLVQKLKEEYAHP